MYIYNIIIIIVIFIFVIMLQRGMSPIKSNHESVTEFCYAVIHPVTAQ